MLIFARAFLFKSDRHCQGACISPDKKKPVPERTPKRAVVLVTRERLVSKLSGDTAGFVHFAKRALMLYCWRAIAHAQNFVRHHPWLDEVVRVLDGHLVK